jgi:hypothetical protein
MNSSPIIAILLWISFNSCKDRASEKLSPNQVIPDTTHSLSNSPAQSKPSPNDTISIPLSIKFFDVDDYPVTNDILRKYATTVKDGYQYTSEYVWFSDRRRNQTMVFELYTDFHRLWTYNFFDDEVSPWALKKMEVSIPDKQASEYIKNVISSANNVDDKYFITSKGFVLGDQIQKAVDQYGKPDQTFKRDELDIYHWEFMGDNTYEYKKFRKEKVDLNGKPIARNSHGHEVFMLIHTGRIVGILFHNLIP